MIRKSSRTGQNSSFKNKVVLVNHSAYLGKFKFRISIRGEKTIKYIDLFSFHYHISYNDDLYMSS